MGKDSDQPVEVQRRKCLARALAQTATSLRQAADSLTLAAILFAADYGCAATRPKPETSRIPAGQESESHAS